MPGKPFSTLILALSCYLAGVHYRWFFILLGRVFAVIAVGLGLLDQLSTFAVAVPAAGLAVWIAIRHALASRTCKS